MVDPGSGLAEEPVSGCKPAALVLGDAPICPPGSAPYLPASMRSCR
jgi:hypothetical protein